MQDTNTRNKKTPFGKELTKIRLYNNETQKEMADKLQISTTFLSWVENGVKNPSVDWCSKIIKNYNLNETEIKELEISYILSTQLTFPKPCNLSANEIEFLSNLLNREDLKMIADYFVENKEAILKEMGEKAE